MRLTGKPLELTLNLIKQMKDDPEASVSIEVATSLVDTIVALQQENEQYQEQLKEIETTARAIIRDRTEQDKVLIMAQDIEKMCGIVGEKITKALMHKNRELQQENKRLGEYNNTAKIGWSTYDEYSKRLEQENEQLRAQVARMREVLEFICNEADFETLQEEIRIRDVIRKALSCPQTDYHNPADVEALKKAREALEHCRMVIDNIAPRVVPRPTEGMQIADEALAEIDRAIGGKEDGI